MAISKVQGEFKRSASANTVTTPFTTQPTAGNLLLAWARCSLVAAATPAISGWERVLSVQYGTSNGQASLFFKNALAGESSDVVLVSTGSDSVALSIEEWTGIPNAVVDKTASTANSGGALTKSSGTTAKTTAAEELAIFIAAFGDVVASPTWDAEVTLEVQNASGSIVLIGGSKILSSVAQVQSDASWTNTRVCGAAVATFKAGTSGIVVPVFMNQYKQRWS